MEGRLREIRERGRAKPVGSLVESAAPFYLSALRDARIEGLEEIVTDVPDVYGEIQAYLKGYQTEDLPKLRLYDICTSNILKHSQKTPRNDSASSEFAYTYYHTAK